MLNLIPILKQKFIKQINGNYKGNLYYKILKIKHIAFLMT